MHSGQAILGGGMIDFFVNSTQTAQMAGRASAAESHAAVSGSLMGQAARLVDSPMDLLADAAEELTFAADTTDEFELEEREERERAAEAMEERIKLYQDLMHEAGKSQDIDRLKDGIRAREGRESAIRQARSRFPDPSDAWAALAEILADLEKEEAASPGSVGEAVLSDVRAGLAELEKDSGPQIRAGIQGALTAAGFPDLGSADELRGLYRQTVCDFQTVNDVFAHILDKYGDIGFDKAMDFLFRALGNDLATDVPSMEKTHLEHVQSNLGQVRLLQSAHVLCEKLLQRWETVHGGTASCTSLELLGDIVNLRNENFIGSLQIDRIAAKANSPDIEHEVLFLQELLNTARSFPSKLFDGDQGRMKVIDAIQESVDRAIEREDAFLASQEGEL